ncbi:hypothetical protein [Odonata-associated circular virus-7]|uniref:Uncharacterized protein n=1 Tax=Odonata-associated circular virus-7 TaxID=1592127 RepID=A0A0B4UGI0_9VIRU|nr:hypothetical protein [Odonata-associated circular virus-7]AJD07471.1 hypothetical protein [Odonata-associated circular virus-7]
MFNLDGAKSCDFQDPCWCEYIRTEGMGYIMDIDGADITEFQPDEFIDLGDSRDDETIVISSDSEDDKEDIEWLEEIRKRTRLMKREIVKAACEQLAEELINKN